MSDFVERGKGVVESGLEAAVHERQQVLFLFGLGLLVNTDLEQGFLHDAQWIRRKVRLLLTKLRDIALHQRGKGQAAGRHKSWVAREDAVHVIDVTHERSVPSSQHSPRAMLRESAQKGENLFGLSLCDRGS